MGLNKAKYFMIRLVVIFGSIFVSNCSALPGNKYVLSDDNLSTVEGDISFQEHSEIIDDKTFGSVLRLNENGYAIKHLKNRIDAKEGTLSVWVKPIWDKNETDSHVMMSMRWDNPNQSYMALSYGWWEPLGAKQLYFILSNKEEVVCNSSRQLVLNEWSFITVVWKSGIDGYCKLYVDSSLLADRKINFEGKYFSSDMLYLGSDKGTTENKNRRSSFLMHKLVAYKTAINDEDVKALYLKQASSNKQVNDKKTAWMKEGLMKDLEFKYDEAGRLLENRVIFDEVIDWAYSKENTDKILNRIKDAGFNVYIPCIWHGKGTYYPTNLAHQDQRLKREDDPLMYLITKAHQMGIEVHPWFTVVRREDDKYPMYYDSGTPEYAFNIHKKEYRDFIVDLMLDVVKRYPVDGINLDYIRSMGFCVSDFCKEDYSARYGRSLQSDLVLRRLPGFDARELIEWNKKPITEIVQKFSRAAKALKPSILISIDGHPLNKDLTLQGQDGVTWANENYIDVIFNMDYKEELDVKKAYEIQSKLNEPLKMIMLLALYDKIDGKPQKRSADSIINYVEFTRKSWPNTGIAFYHYPQLDDGVVIKLKNEAFRIISVTSWH